MRARTKIKIVRDPVHEYVSFSQEERKLIDSPWFQRLRHCSQNGPARLVYPSLLGTRFEHSLGVMELASRIFDSIIDRRKYEKPAVVDRFLEMCRRNLKLFLGRRSDKKTVAEDVRRLVRLAALCHDLGQFPLSHTLERAFNELFWPHAAPKYLPRAAHEVVGTEIVRHILETGGIMSDWIARGVILVILCPKALAGTYRQRPLPLSQTMFPALNGIIMGDYDADRVDYLQRDGYLSGSGFGHFDVQRFVNAMSLAEKDLPPAPTPGRPATLRQDKLYSVVPTTGALSTVEAALLERYKLYKWVYFHHKTLYYDELTRHVATKVLGEKSVRKSLFIRDRARIRDPLVYSQSVLDALKKPGDPIPPLVLFDGKGLRLSPGHYRLNPGFFVGNKDTHFFDDVWFCSRCRRRSRSIVPGGYAIQALVERKPCGITAWKDWSQFGQFSAMCAKLGRQSADLERAVETGSFSRYVDRWLTEIWDLMRAGDFPKQLSLLIFAGLKKELQLGRVGGLRPLMRIADWSLFGALDKNEIIGRTGEKEPLLNHSGLLRELSGLKGEIPFYVFVAGKASDIATFKAKTNFRNLLLQVAAKAFINALTENWENFPELKDAWVMAAKEGA